MLVSRAARGRSRPRPTEHITQGRAWANGAGCRAGVQEQRAGQRGRRRRIVPGVVLQQLHQGVCAEGGGGVRHVVGGLDGADPVVLAHVPLLALRVRLQHHSTAPPAHAVSDLARSRRFGGCGKGRKLLALEQGGLCSRVPSDSTNTCCSLTSGGYPLNNEAL